MPEKICFQPLPPTAPHIFSNLSPIQPPPNLHKQFLAQPFPDPQGAALVSIRPTNSGPPAITGAPHPAEWCYLLLLLLTESNQVPQSDRALGLPNTQKNVRLAGSSPSLASSKVPRSLCNLFLSAHPPHWLQPSISDRVHLST